MDTNTTERLRWSHPAYHLDDESRKLLRKPPTFAVRFCKLLINLLVNQQTRRVTLEQRRLNLHFTHVYRDSTFIVFRVNRVVTMRNP